MAGTSPSRFVRQAEFARHRGVSRKTVTQWKSKGLLVLSGEGLVNVEETEWKLDERPPTYRGGVTHQTLRPQKGNAQSSAKPAASKGRPAKSDETKEGDDFDLDAQDLTLAEAARRKENFLGLLRKREYEVANSEWVRIEDVAALVEREYATVRNRLLGIPGKIAQMLVGATRAEIETTLRREVTEALDELHDPSGIGERLGPCDEASSGEGRA